MEITSRYGDNLPDPETMCKGDCEGMGSYPDMDGYPTKYKTIDDVPFVKCETCGGTGLATPKTADREGSDGE